MLDMRKGRCPVCEGREVIEAVPGDSTGAPMAVTQDPPSVLNAAMNVMNRLRDDGPPFPRSHGTLKMCLCRGCGYVQWFVDAPAAVPLGDAYQTRLVDAPKVDREGPYR
jgi:hypothetical protein